MDFTVFRNYNWFRTDSVLECSRRGDLKCVGDSALKDVDSTGTVFGTDFEGAGGGVELREEEGTVTWM